MKICCGCENPVPSCTCSDEVKKRWARNILEKWNIDQRVQEYFKYDPEERKRRLQMIPTETPLYCNNSIEIDDDIWPIINILWNKKYATVFCCAGHPENGETSFYISFLTSYYFDFTTIDFPKGWSYTRTSRQPTLYFSMTDEIRRALKKADIKPAVYLCREREKLLRWAEQLPEAKLHRKSLPLPGVGSRGKIIAKKLLDEA